MTNTIWDHFAEELLGLTDEIADEIFPLNSPEYEVQQSLILVARRYRERKKCVNGST